MSKNNTTAKKSLMDRLIDWMNEHVMPIAGKIGEQKHIVAITRGMMATIPLTIIGGISLILSYPPVPEGMQATGWFPSFMLGWAEWAARNMSILELPNNLTIGLLGLYGAVGVAYHLANQYKIDTIGSVITTIMSYIIVCSPPSPVEGAKGLYMYTRYMGGRGVFAGIVVAIVVVEISRVLVKHKISIRLPDNVPPMVTKPFEALVPGIACVVLFMGVDALLVNLLGMNFPEAVMMMFQPFARAVDSAAGMGGIQFLINFLWFFGIYGSAAPDAVTSGFFATNLAANMDAHAAGEPLPAIAVAAFRPAFGNIGGCGSAFALAICVLIFARSAHLRTIGKVGIIPSIFGIAEPMTFGVPLVFNPLMLVPMIVASVFNTVVSFLMMQWNIVGRIYVNVPWTTPKILDSFLATMDWKAPVMVTILIIIDILIYMPFVKVYDGSLLKKEQEEAAAAAAEAKA